MLRIERRSRLPHPPVLLMLGALMIWGGVVLVDHWTAAQRGDEPMICCHVRQLTGVACATCGGTRSAAALLGGDLPQALRFNPLIALLLSAGTIVMVARLVAGRQVVLNCSRAGWWWLAGIIVTAVAVNWWYVSAAGASG